jgi:Ser/Thr protein kinase RdoA (MazF antagonist)
MDHPGRLVGAGRSADVFALADGTVLRRHHRPRDTELEVAAMEHARAHGFPVPAARALDETDIVMEGIRGHTMVADLGRRPWRLPDHARTLASLHRRLHAIEAPAWLPAPLGEGKALLHLDLHPENVIFGERGPVVIDWTNAARGPEDADVAFTWIVLAHSLPPHGLYRRATSRAGRALFLRIFLNQFERRRIADHLPAVCAYRLDNRELPRGEVEAIRELLERLTPSAKRT